MRRAAASVLAGTFALMALAGCTAKASPYKSVTLIDFERLADPVSESPHYDIPTALKKPNYINHDFRWNTSGYAVMEPVSKEEAKKAKNKPLYKFFHGKTAAKVRFSVPGDYKKINPDNKPKTWETGMTLSTDSYTSLPVTDWSPWAYLNIDFYNPGEKDLTLHVRFADSAANVTEASAVVVAGGASTLEFDLRQLALARLNVKDMRALTLYLDTADEQKDPVLIFDNIGLHTGTVEERRKAEVEEEAAEEEEEDWDSEEEEEGKLKTGIVSRPSGITGTAPEAGAPQPQPEAAQ